MNRTDTKRLEQIEQTEAVLTPRQMRWKMHIWKMTVQISHTIKRAFDILVAALLLILFAPIFAFTALAIIIEDPGPVFYSQIRIGKDGLPFRFFKFRSMIANADKQKTLLSKSNESADGVIFKMRHDPRITRVGRIIRRFSIDELPQIINVLRGDMSLVGPRPALPGEVEQYTLEQRKRLHATPGITCLWQVSGRSDIPFTGQVRLDLDYIQSTSMKKDLMILIKTVPAVLSGKGAY